MKSGSPWGGGSRRRRSRKFPAKNEPEKVKSETSKRLQALSETEGKARPPKTVGQTFDVAVVGGGLPGWAAAARLAAEKMRVLVLAPDSEEEINGISLPKGPLYLWGLHRNGLWYGLLASLGLHGRLEGLSPEALPLQVILPLSRIDVPPAPEEGSYEHHFSNGAAKRLRNIYLWAARVEESLRISGLASPPHSKRPAQPPPLALTAAWLKTRFAPPFRARLPAGENMEASSFLDAQGAFCYGLPTRKMSRHSAALALSCPRHGLWRIPGGASELARWIGSGITAAGGEIRTNIGDLQLRPAGRRHFQMTAGANGGGAHYTATHVISEASLSPESGELHPNANRSCFAVWSFAIEKEAVPDSLGPRSLIVIDPGKPPVGENLVALENAPASKSHNEGEKKKDVTIFRAWILASERGNADRLAARIRKAVEGAIPFLDYFLIADRFYPPAFTPQAGRSRPRNHWVLSNPAMEDCFGAAEGVELATRILRTYGQ